MPKLRKHQKRLVDIIREEGATVEATRNGSKHMKVDYTFDGQQFFTQLLPYGEPTGSHWEGNFRAAIRRTRP